MRNVEIGVVNNGMLSSDGQGTDKQLIKNNKK